MSLGHIELFKKKKILEEENELLRKIKILEEENELLRKIKILEEEKRVLENNIEELKIIRDNILKEDSNMVDISDLYSLKMDNIIYFVKIGSNSIIYNFFNGIRLCNSNDYKIQHINLLKKEYKELLLYPNEKVPKIFLQLLYYKANNIDSKMLKITYSEKTSN